MTRIEVAKNVKVFLKKIVNFEKNRNIALKVPEYFTVFWTFGIQISFIEIFYLIVCIMAQRGQRVYQNYISLHNEASTYQNSLKVH